MPPTLALPQPQWHPVEAIAAWLLPGMGHFLLGQRRRALVLGVTILALWLCGILVGGISVVDHWAAPEIDPNTNIQMRGFSFPFLGQALVGPSLMVDWYRNRLPEADPGRPNPSLAYQPSYGRPNEIGTLLTALAGLLNLLALIDVVYCDPRPRRDDAPPVAAPPATAPPASAPAAPAPAPEGRP